MSQQIKGEDGSRHAQQNPVSKIPAKRKRRLFEPGYLANNGWGIVLLCVAFWLLSTILPSAGRGAYVAAAIGLTCILGLVVHGFVRRNVRTDEEINEEFRQQTDETLNKLKTQIGAVERRIEGRRLTAEQIQVVADFLKQANAVFKVKMQYHPMARDGSQLARTIGEALSAAGWTILDDFRFNSHAEFPFHFSLNPQHEKTAPIPVQLLVAALKACGGLPSEGRVVTDADMPLDTVGIYVGMAP